ncbi:MAG: FtsB family cell division protein [Fastidiosipilaceae bacterium]|jgi:cell division protein DivIC|nr:septum formation initiator family protein [Clostridiaceae bacterium]
MKTKGIQSNEQNSVPVKKIRLTGPFIVFLLVILVIATVIVLVRQQNTRAQLLERQSELNEQLDAVSKESESLASQLENVNNDDYIERIARDELGMVRPGEIVFDSASDPIDER